MLLQAQRDKPHVAFRIRNQHQRLFAALFLEVLNALLQGSCVRHGLLRDFQSGDVQRYLLLVTLGTVSVLVYVIRLH